MTFRHNTKILLALIGLSSPVVIAATGDIDGGIAALHLGWDDKSEFEANLMIGIETPNQHRMNADSGFFRSTLMVGLPYSYLTSDHGPGRMSIPGLLPIGTGLAVLLPVSLGAMLYAPDDHALGYGLGIGAEAAGIAALCMVALTDADLSVGTPWASIYGTQRFDLLWPGWHPRERVSAGAQIGVPGCFLRFGAFHSFATLSAHSGSGYEWRIVLGG